MSSSSEKNKRIAKNTVYLYIRMFLSMIVSFYTSRVVLQVLGIEDYGIYNIVGGLVILFTFLNSSLVTAIQRFFNLAVGRGDLAEQQRLFSASFRLFFFLALILIALLETVGLWFLNNELNIPPAKYHEANIVYQISVATMAISLFRIPYNAYILAQEKMQFYAYVSIFETVLKLLVVFLLVELPFDKLSTYATLYLLVAVLINVIYIWYSRRNFPRMRFSFKSDSSSVKEISVFSGWMALAGVADMGYMQGTNVIVNLFCGVLYNATMGITNNLKNAVFSFVRNLMIAAQPQIMKSYAAGEYDYFRSLMVSVSKFSFFMFFIISFPLVLNMKFVLEIWLNDYPPQTELFCILCMIFCMVDSLISPLWTAAQIKGNIKRYQIVTGMIILMNVPFSFIALYLGFPPYSVFVIQIILNCLSIIYRVSYLHGQSIFKAPEYFRKVMLPIVYVILSVVPALYIVTLFTDGLERFCITVPACIIMVLASVYFIGLNISERHKVSAIVVNRLKIRRK